MIAPPATPLKITSWGLLLITILLSSYTYITGIYNVDNSWLMIAAERFLNGDKLYVDIMETNPPLIIYLYSIPSLLSDLFTIPPYASLIICTQLLMMICTLWSIRYADHKTGWLIASLASLWLLVGRDFAQREHLFIILSWPLIAALLHSKKPSLATIIFAGIGTAIKPYFALLWIGLALADAIEHKSIRPLFARHYLLLAAIQIIYAALIYLLHPDYINQVMMTLSQGYHYYNGPIDEIIAGRYLPFLNGLIIIGISCLLCRSTHRATHFLFAIAGLLACALLQQKGFPYHFYPAMCLMLLSMCWQVTRIKPSRLMERVALGLLAMMILLNAMKGPLWVYRLLSPKTDASTIELTNQLASHAQNQPVFTLGFDLVYPRVILKSDADFPYRYAQLWPLPSYILSKPSDLIAIASEAEQRFHTGLVDEFIAQPPKAVLVSERPYYWYQEDRHFTFDFIAYLAQDARFKDAWNDYEQITKLPRDESSQEEDYYVLYVRKELP